MALNAYASATSVVQGSCIDCHVSNDAAGMVQIEVSELSGNSRLPLLTDKVFAGHYTIPEHAYEVGCGWPKCYKLKVPFEWPSGLYRILLSNSEHPPARAEVYFVVKSACPGLESPTLLQFAATTCQAYNNWGGKSLYPSDSPHRARKVSFDRPGGADYLRELGFLVWMRRKKLPVECCTSLDLHEDRQLLFQYQLFLSVGHDEYWSKEMRDNVEDFVEDGGNVAFFSGNICWWQVRFEDKNRTMVCYRHALEDPMVGRDNSRVTVNWHSAPVSRPENYLTGVSFRNGAGIWQPCGSSMGMKAFEVRHSKHWVFEGTGLREGEAFGTNESIVGYETDAADYYVDSKGGIRLTGRDGTPPSFIVLATADLGDWGKCGKAGRATMGIFRRNGTVFTVGTTDWVRGLFRSNGIVATITSNVISRLAQRGAGSQWEVIGDAAETIAICAREGKLFGATRDGALCWREPIGQNIQWTVIGSAADVVAMAAGENRESRLGQELYAATSSGMILRRDPVVEDVGWEEIGELADVSGLAASQNHLFATTRNNQFWSCEIGSRESWKSLSQIGSCSMITALDDLLIGADNSGRLQWSVAIRGESPGSEIPWRVIGDVPKSTIGLAAIEGRMFAVTQENQLWWRDAVPDSNRV